MVNPNQPNASNPWPRRIGLLIASAASVATVATLWLQVRTRSVEAQIQILGTAQLTNPPELPGLLIAVTHNGRVITDLWKVRLRFVNTGDLTLLTEGPKQNVLKGGLDVVFPTSTRVLEVTLESSSFPQELTSDHASQLHLAFSQWRVGEAADYTVWLTAPSRLSAVPAPKISTRNIVDGEVRVIDLTSRILTGPTPFLDSLPRPLPFVGRLLGGILCGLIIIVGLYVVIGAPLEFAKIRYWHSKWYGEFQKWLDQLPKTRLDRMPAPAALLKGNPSWLPDAEWEGFKGPKFPTRSPAFESWSELILGLVLGGMALFASAALMALIFKA